jgi:hypothetical protein
VFDFYLTLSISDPAAVPGGDASGGGGDHSLWSSIGSFGGAVVRKLAEAAPRVTRVEVSSKRGVEDMLRGACEGIVATATAQIIGTKILNMLRCGEYILSFLSRLLLFLFIPTVFLTVWFVIFSPPPFFFTLCLSYLPRSLAAAAQHKAGAQQPDAAPGADGEQPPAPKRRSLGAVDAVRAVVVSAHSDMPLAIEALVKTTSLYLPSAATRAILLRPVKSNVQDALARFFAAVEAEYEIVDQAEIMVFALEDFAPVVAGI